MDAVESVTDQTLEPQSVLYSDFLGPMSLFWFQHTRPSRNMLTCTPNVRVAPPPATMAWAQCQAGREGEAELPRASSSLEELPPSQNSRARDAAQGSREQRAWDLGPASANPAEELPGAKEDRTPGPAAP